MGLWLSGWNIHTENSVYTVLSSVNRRVRVVEGTEESSEAWAVKAGGSAHDSVYKRLDRCRQALCPHSGTVWKAGWGFGVASRLH